MKRITLFVLAAACSLALACNKGAIQDNPYPGLARVSYVENKENIANPERGFYSGSDLKSESSGPLKGSTLKAMKLKGRTIVYTGVYLADYMEGEISQKYLDIIQNQFDSLRVYGMKCILRFAYKSTYSETAHPWDASKEQMLVHIAQLKPLLQKNSDVILCLQAGLIGVWGEWYYTDNFSDPTLSDRKEIVAALLDALPSDRQICIRTPEYKQKLYGFSLADTLTRAEAFANTPKARLAGHNDCFVSSSNDVGTFRNNSDREYWYKETQYLIMGGETCAKTAFCECSRTIDALEKQHWTYLNVGYHPNVISSWKTEGCYDQIALRLGYRFVLDNCYFEPSATAGADYRAVINIRNDGFASPVNPRGLELVWLTKDGTVASKQPIDDDPRFWSASHMHTLDLSVKAPSTPGEYTLCLNLPDGSESLKDNPDYSIRLANVDTWDPATGFNKLRKVKVDAEK